MSDEQTTPTQLNPAYNSRLTIDQQTLILKLNDGERTQAEIAKVMGISQQRVSYFLSKFKDTRAIAKARLYAEADNMALRVAEAAVVAAKRGDASPALEILDRTDTLPKRAPSGAGGGTKVVVVVGNVTPPKLDDAEVVQALPAGTTFAVES